MINAEMLQYGSEKSSIREIAAYAAGRKAALGADKVFDFSLGNPSAPAPDEVRASIERALTLPSMALHGYTPAVGLPEARQAVAASLNRRYGVDYAAGDLFLTAGAAPALAATFRALTEPGESEIIVIAPYFPEYKLWIEAAGARCVEVLANQETFDIDVEAVSAAITEKTCAIVVDSPNNPTGKVYPEETLRALSRALDEAERRFGTKITLVSDEPYREITYGCVVPWIPSIHDRTVVTYSYSKALSLPGERIGWVCVPPTHPEHDEVYAAVAGASRILGHVCAPSLFQRVLIDCVDVPADVEAYARNREALTSGLSDAGYTYVEPDGAFYLWVRALEPDANAFFERAKALELLPVPSDSFGCKGWVRVGYCVPYSSIVDSMPAWRELAHEYA